MQRGRRRASDSEVDGGGDEHTKDPLLKGYLAQYDKCISMSSKVHTKAYLAQYDKRSRWGPGTARVLLYIHVRQDPVSTDAKGNLGRVLQRTQGEQ